MQDLAPDSFELKVAGTIGIIPKCPFCGKWPNMFTRFNPGTEIYGARIICDAVSCGATLQANSKDRSDAQQRAITKWSKRV